VKGIQEEPSQDPKNSETAAVVAGPADPSDPRTRHPSRFARAGRGGLRRGRWALLVSVIAAVALLSALFAFGLSRDPTVIRSGLLGRPAPDFALRTLEGSGLVHLSALRGQVVVINFWASWCAACREEHPSLLAAWERYRDQGVALVGIDFEDQKRPALDFMREMGGDWPVVEDPGGRTALNYGVYGVPETFFIGPDGVIRYKQIGPSSYELLSERIERLLSQRR